MQRGRQRLLHVLLQLKGECREGDECHEWVGGRLRPRCPAVVCGTLTATKIAAPTYPHEVHVWGWLCCTGCGTLACRSGGRRRGSGSRPGMWRAAHRATIGLNKRSGAARGGRTGQAGQATCCLTRRASVGAGHDCGRQCTGREDRNDAGS